MPTRRRRRSGFDEPPSTRIERELPWWKWPYDAGRDGTTMSAATGDDAQGAVAGGGDDDGVKAPPPARAGGGRAARGAVKV
jgi:hypothetical protein